MNDWVFYAVSPAALLLVAGWRLLWCGLLPSLLVTGVHRVGPAVVVSELVWTVLLQRWTQHGQLCAASACWRTSWIRTIKETLLRLLWCLTWMLVVREGVSNGWDCVDVRSTTTVFVCPRIPDTEGCASPTVISTSDDPSVPRSLRELLQLKGAYATAATVFNTSSKKGLAALGQALGRELTARDVACFLRFGRGLSECGLCTRPVPAMPSLCRPHVFGLQH
jgi:hypothetical protein